MVSCFNEELSIMEFHQRLSKSLNNLDRTYEIIFVDDGSADTTYEKLKEIYHKDKNVSVVIELFKNSGQAEATTAGISFAKGKNFIFMDSDLQISPEDLPLLMNEFDKGYDIVGGVRKNRQDSIHRIIPSKLANVIMRKASSSKFSDFGCTFKIINGKLIRAFNMNAFNILNQMHIISHAKKCQEVPIQHHKRKYGKSGWKFKRLMEFNIDNMVVLSQRPFQMISFFSLIFGCLIILRILFYWLVSPLQILKVVTPTSILIFVLFSMFVIVSILCIIGEYVTRVFVVSQRKPKYIIREILKRDYE